MLIICGFPDPHNLAVNFPVELFIDTQLFTGIDDFTMLCIKDVPRTVKYHNRIQINRFAWALFDSASYKRYCGRQIIARIVALQLLQPHGL